MELKDLSPDTFTGRRQGLLDVKNALRDLARHKAIQVRRQALIAGLCHQLQQIHPKRASHEEWGSF